MPIRGGYAREVFIVSSGEMMALYAANNIAQAIKNFGRRGYARLKGIILNAKNIENEQELVAKAAAEIETEVVMYVPRSGDIQTAENQAVRLANLYRLRRWSRSIRSWRIKF